MGPAVRALLILLACAVPSWAGPPTLGSQANLKLHSASATSTFISNIDAGNSIVVIYFQTGASARTATVTDECLNTYVLAANGPAYGSNQSVAIFVAYASVCSDASLQVTLTQSGSIASYNFKVLEVVADNENQADTSSALANAAATTHNASADATVIDTAVNAFVIAACESTADIGTKGAKMSWTALESAASNRSMAQVISTASALTNDRAQQTSSNTVTTQCAVVSLKDSGAAVSENTLWVCADAANDTCGGTPDYTTLALAVADAVCGDVIRMKANEVFTASTTLTDKGDCSANPIVITTTETVGVPPAGDRICPIGVDAITEGWCVANIDPALMPKLQSIQDAGNQNVPAIIVAAGAQGWTLRLLEIRNNFTGSGSTVRFGQNNTTDQYQRAHQPDTILADQVFWNLRGQHPYWGQKRALELHCTNCGVTNSYFDGPNTVGADANAIWAINGAGPITIRNNWIRGTTENIMFGGDTAHIKTIATFTGTPSTTGGDLTWGAGPTPNGDCPFVGQTIAVSISGATDRDHAQITSVSSCTATTATVTWSPALSATPDNPGDARWGMVPGSCAFEPTPCETGVLIEYNSMSRDPDWRTDPVVPVPTGFTPTAGAGGSLTAGTYTVSVQARTVSAGTTIFSDDTTPVPVVVGASGSISWTATAGHADISTYRVYITLAGTTTFTDFGTNSGTITTAGTSGSLPTTGSFWQLKNLFELKACIDCIIRYNVFFNSWSAQNGDGTAIWNKSVNQNLTAGGSAPWMENTDVLYEYNVCHTVPGAFKTGGNEYETSNNYHRTKGTTRLTVRNLLCYDISNVTYGINGQEAFGFGQGCIDCTVEHVTVDNTGNAFTLELDSNTTKSLILENFVFRDNMLTRPNSAGGVKASGFAEGTVSIESTEGCNCVGLYTFTSNIFGNRASGPSGGSYPSGNTFVAYATWQNEFADSTAWMLGDHHEAIIGYTLDEASVYHNAATDGTDIGVQNTALMAEEIAKARSGTIGEEEPPDTPPATHTFRLLLGVG